MSAIIGVQAPGNDFMIINFTIIWGLPVGFMRGPNPARRYPRQSDVKVIVLYTNWKVGRSVSKTLWRIKSLTRYRDQVIRRQR